MADGTIVHEGHALSVVERKAIEAGIEITQRVPAGNDLSFVHAAFTQVCLPRIKTPGRDYFHQCGATWLRVTAGSISLEGREHKAGLPYGALARLALAHINTFVVTRDRREVPIASSANAWLKALCKTQNKASADLARKTLGDLAACNLVIGRGDRTEKESIVRAIHGWREGPDGSLWPTCIEVTRDYAADLKEHAVPLDHRALKALSGSSLALDLYTWLSYRLYRVSPSRPERLSWTSLEMQFAASSLTNVGDWRGSWRRSFRRQLALVSEVYCGKAVTADERGLVIRHCKPPVPLAARVRVDNPCA